MKPFDVENLFFICFKWFQFNLRNTLTNHAWSILCYIRFRMNLNTINVLTQWPFKILKVCLHIGWDRRLQGNLELFFNHSQLLSNYHMHISRIFQSDLTPPLGNNYLFIFCSNNVDCLLCISQHQFINLHHLFTTLNLM